LQKRYVVNLENEVIKIVSETGEVVPEYGGYEITLVKPGLFPWYVVLDLLIEPGQEIWITKYREIRINTKSKVE
jgi:hypothetical protein